MPKKQALPYIIIDTNAWVTFFCYKAKRSDLRKDVLETEKHEIASNVAALIDGNGKEHQIIMPTAIYVELLGIIRGKGRTPTSRKRVVDEAISKFKTIDFIPVDLDEAIAQDSESLIKAYELTGIDAAILASAAYYEVRRVFTCDDKLLKVGNSIPGVSVELPPPPTTLQYGPPEAKE